jgi:hypothetical protein
VCDNKLRSKGDRDGNTNLDFLEVLEDLNDVLADHLRVIDILRVQVVPVVTVRVRLDNAEHGLLEVRRELIVVLGVQHMLDLLALNITGLGRRPPLLRLAVIRQLVLVLRVLLGGAAGGADGVPGLAGRRASRSDRRVDLHLRLEHHGRLLVLGLLLDLCERLVLGLVLRHSARGPARHGCGAL